MKSNFAACLDVSLQQEGGWSNHPADKGGPTMKGVTIATMRRFFPAATLTDLRNITPEQLQVIYERYWSDVRGDTLGRGVDLATFDYGITSGPETARKALLKVVGGKDAETVQKLCARRLSSYQTFKNWKTFGKGWTRRVARIEAKGVAWALAAASVLKAPVKEKLEAEQKKASTKAATQTAGGTAAGGSTVAPIGAENLDQVGGLVLGGLVVAAVLLAAFLFWRAYVNAARAEAYKDEVTSS